MTEREQALCFSLALQCAFLSDKDGKKLRLRRLYGADLPLIFLDCQLQPGDHVANIRKEYTQT